jgi:hypothetical protein
VVDGNDVGAVFTTAKEAVDLARAGDGPILIEAKTFRRQGHAQHDPAEYVPAEMKKYWEERDPIARHEKFLFKEKFLDEKGKKEIEAKIGALLGKERDFAESSPMPPAEFAEHGVFCTGDDCHQIRAKWERPVAEVTPPKSSVAGVWTVEGFGSGKGSGGGSAPIHFGDTEKHEERDAAPASQNGAKRGAKRSAKAAKKRAAKKPAVAARKAGR